MYFEPNPVDSKAEKQAFLSNKIKDNGEFEGSDPTGSWKKAFLGLKSNNYRHMLVSVTPGSDSQ
jgi:hypothetical protein